MTNQHVHPHATIELPRAGTTRYRVLLLQTQRFDEGAIAGASDLRAATHRRVGRSVVEEVALLSFAFASSRSNPVRLARDEHDAQPV